MEKHDHRSGHMGRCMEHLCECGERGANRADWNQSAGDGLLTRDTVSGLEWLDVTLTINQTYDQVRTGNWYQAGFSHATMAELQTAVLGRWYTR